MSLWQIIGIMLLVISIFSVAYISLRISNFEFFANFCKNKIIKLFIAFVIVATIFGMLVWQLKFINAVIVFLYASIIWLICDVLFWGVQKLRKKNFKYYYAGWLAIIISCLYLFNGWYQAHNVWKTDYNIITNKKVQNLRIIMFADAHVGTTFDGEGLANHMKEMQKHNPDMLVITGDFVDNGTSKDEMMRSLKSLAEFKSKYGVYLVLGNHDKSSNGKAFRGFSNDEFIDELKKHGVKVLQDEIELIDNEFYVIGRKDAFDERRGYSRKSMKEMLRNIDKNKLMIVFDHQPNDYKNQIEEDIDLVLSGHTHGGQLFPINNVSKWMGMNDKIYGHEKIKNTDFIVTSGISDWEIKFKTGCRSEFVIIDIKSE